MNPGKQDNSRRPAEFVACAEKNKKQQLCPMVANPGKSCYCRDMNSNKISMAVYYCLNHYRQCEIYRQMMRSKRHDGR